MSSCLDYAFKTVIEKMCRSEVFHAIKMCCLGVGILWYLILNLPKCRKFSKNTSILVPLHVHLVLCLIVLPNRHLFVPIQLQINRPSWISSVNTKNSSLSFVLILILGTILEERLLSRVQMAIVTCTNDSHTCRTNNLDKWSPTSLSQSLYLNTLYYWIAPYFLGLLFHPFLLNK